MVFKLKIADIIGGWIDVNNLRVRDRDVYIEEAYGEAYYEYRKGNVVK